MSTQLEIAQRVGYISEERCAEAQTLLDECLAVTYGLKKAVKREQ